MVLVFCKTKPFSLPPYLTPGLRKGSEEVKTGFYTNYQMDLFTIISVNRKSW